MATDLELMETEEYKKFAKEVACDLGYGKEVADKLDASKDEKEISRIMATARNSF